MTEKTIKYLSDIQYAISLIDDFLKDIESFSIYQYDPKSQSAIERQLEIIGEIINKFSREENGVVLSHTKQMVDFHRRIIHSSENIDASVVWEILKNQLSLLQKEVDEILNGLIKNK
ncbi:MAG: DUF86 domain-containing protein [Prevotellaceae bacterium]|jgi:uncharacterized protein with HEPN domain|nr:DUF86 domain-containing protein [Prevotellaceae bacterium]